jgi:hypothetical protein
MSGCIGAGFPPTAGRTVPVTSPPAMLRSGTSSNLRTYSSRSLPVIGAARRTLTTTFERLSPAVSRARSGWIRSPDRRPSRAGGRACRTPCRRTPARSRSVRAGRSARRGSVHGLTPGRIRPWPWRASCRKRRTVWWHRSGFRTRVSDGLRLGESRRRDGRPVSIVCATPGAAHDTAPGRRSGRPPPSPELTTRLQLAKPAT